MATGPKIVHKQFNSPMGLYSQQNIKETLNKHLQNLDNGTVGIDFSNPQTEKPGNLANSAVLRMLEEEERNRMGYPSQKKVVWPPVPETNGYHQLKPQSPAQYSAQHSPSGQQQQQQQYNQPAQQYNHPSQQYNQPSQQYHQPSQHHNQPSQQYNQPSQQYNQPSQQYNQPSQQYHQPSQQYQPPKQQYQQPSQQYQPQNQSYDHPAPSQEPAYCDGRRQEATGLSKLIPFGPGVTASNQANYRPAPQSPSTQAQSYRQQPSSRWAPVPPVSPQAYGSQPTYPQQPDYQSPYSPLSEPTPPKPFSPPPSTITLRPQPPIHQKPSPVFASQPAAASYNGGPNMRGDQKWPPQSVKEAVEAENDARRQLARGPACRPRKMKKDYSSFFAQNALNNNYPGYRAPPGTQHYEDNSGRSSY